jgi:hypothetical protein
MVANSMVRYSPALAAAGRALIPYAKPAVNYLFQKAKGRFSAPAPSAVIKGTKLKSYLDRTYAKKCGVEVKQLDVVGSYTATSTLATFASPFLNIVQGIDDADRIGASFEVKNCPINVTMYAGAASASAVFVRFILVKQNRMQQAALAAGSILETSTNIRSPYALDVTKSFTILKDKTFKLSALTSGEDSAFKQLKFTYTPKGCHECTFTQADTTGVIGNMTEGNLQLMIMYQGATAPTLDFWCRPNWVDL